MAAVSTLATLGMGGAIRPTGGADATAARARSVTIEFFRSQNERRYDDTCRLLARGFYRAHRLPDQQTCVASLRISFMWNGQITFRIGTVALDGNRVLVQATADGSPGRIVLVREQGDLKILAVEGD
jgi:hypothetical protein